MKQRNIQHYELSGYQGYLVTMPYVGYVKSDYRGNILQTNLPTLSEDYARVRAYLDRLIMNQKTKGINHA